MSVFFYKKSAMRMAPPCSQGPQVWYLSACYYGRNICWWRKRCLKQEIKELCTCGREKGKKFHGEHVFFFSP